MFCVLMSVAHFLLMHKSNAACQTAEGLLKDQCHRIDIRMGCPLIAIDCVSVGEQEIMEISRICDWVEYKVELSVSHICRKYSDYVVMFSESANDANFILKCLLFL